MLSTVCEKSPDDSYIMHEEKFTESFDSANFFIQYKPETKEFFSAATITLFSWLRRDLEQGGEWSQDTCLQGSPRNRSWSAFRRSAWQVLHADNVSKGCQEKFLLSLAHLCIRLRKQLPCNNRILIYKFYFKIKVFDTVCYGEFDCVRVSRAITISADGNYCVANVEIDGCFPEDFIKHNPPMSIILQYDLYSIETNMLVSKEEFDAYWEKCKDLCES